jgi:hypothetical protein
MYLPTELEKMVDDRLLQPTWMKWIWSGLGGLYAKEEGSTGSIEQRIVKAAFLAQLARVVEFADALDYDVDNVEVMEKILARMDGYEKTIQEYTSTFREILLLPPVDRVDKEEEDKEEEKTEPGGENKETRTRSEAILDSFEKILQTEKVRVICCLCVCVCTCMCICICMCMCMCVCVYTYPLPFTSYSLQPSHTPPHTLSFHTYTIYL